MTNAELYKEYKLLQDQVSQLLASMERITHIIETAPEQFPDVAQLLERLAAIEEKLKFGGNPPADLVARIEHMERAVMFPDGWIIAHQVNRVMLQGRKRGMWASVYTVRTEQGIKWSYGFWPLHALPSLPIPQLSQELFDTAHEAVQFIERTYGA